MYKTHGLTDSSALKLNTLVLPSLLTCNLAAIISIFMVDKLRGQVYVSILGLVSFGLGINGS